ncbi:MAG TPA: DJ-1/PfpI family protein [Gaiellaceae bacterium]|jgi:transcriptional regulator GlxA family with amidase domain
MDEFRIAIALWDGVEELDFAGPYEVLAAWARGSERPVTVTAVSRSTEPVTCSHGLRIIPDTSFDELGDVDLFVNPGGRIDPLLADDAYIERLRAMAESGTLMTSVCNGALVLQKANLLEGRRAATHWGSYDRLEELGVEVDREARWVDEGMVVTSAGVSAGIDMALHLVARLGSEEMSAKVRRYIQYEPEPGKQEY